MTESSIVLFILFSLGWKAHPMIQQGSSRYGMTPSGNIDHAPKGADLEDAEIVILWKHPKHADIIGVPWEIPEELSEIGQEKLDEFFATIGDLENDIDSLTAVFEERKLESNDD